jgi:hypothetical protein
MEQHTLEAEVDQLVLVVIHVRKVELAAKVMDNIKIVECKMVLTVSVEAVEDLEKVVEMEELEDLE